MDNKQKVAITLEEYNVLIRDSLELGVLYEFGVDSWGGYEEAIEYADELKENAMAEDFSHLYC